MKTLRNSVAVVTGAGSGIGRALALELALQGAQLALADVNAANLEQTRDQISSSVKTKTYIVDVSDSSAMESFAGNVEQDFGRASVLINNAGVALYGNFAELTLQEFDWLFRINFWGVVHGCKFFLPLLKREPEAHIVNISSAFGLIAPAGQTAYASSKFAVRGFTQALRQELAGSTVSATCVHPGGIRTNIAGSARAAAAAALPADWSERHENFHKIARTSPEKAAQIIVRGILRNKARVLIGADGHQFDILQRLFPARCAAIIGAYFSRKMNANAPAQETQEAVKAKT